MDTIPIHRGDTVEQDAGLAEKIHWREWADIVAR